MSEKLRLELGAIPPSHTPVGYVAYVKVLDEDGQLYWALRSDGLNDMEKLGMAEAMATTFAAELQACTRHTDDDPT